MTRTADLMVIHNIDDEGFRDALGKLLLAAGDGVEIQWIAPTRAVAMIGPSDLAPEAETVE